MGAGSRQNCTRDFIIFVDGPGPPDSGLNFCQWTEARENISGALCASR